MGTPLAARTAERERLLAVTRSGRPSAFRFEPRSSPGSVARGDFDLRSDVVVAAARLPERALDRATLLLADVPAGIQPVGYTRAELAAPRRRGDRLVASALGEGVVAFGSAGR